MMRPRSPHRSSGGFTLMELLLAIAVGAVVLVAIQTTFFGALRLHNTTHARIDADLVVQRTLGIVRRDLAGLMLPGTLAGQLQTANFSSLTTGSYGERASPDFFTTSGKVDGWSPFSELQMVAYYLAPSTDANAPRDAHDLVRVVTRNLLPVQDAAPDEQVLLHGVSTANVLFYDGESWTDAWDSEATSTLPTAVKFSLTMAALDPSQPALSPSEVVVPVMVTTRTSLRQAQQGATP